MADLSALLIDAAAKGRAARAEAWAALMQPPPVPTDAEVAAVLATLPAKMAETLTRDPNASHVDVLTARTRAEKALAQAVLSALHAHGVATTMHGFGASEPVTVRADIGALLCAADAAEERAALTAFEAAWSTLTDGVGSALVNHSAATLIASAPAGSYTLAPGWQKRPTGDLVEEARKALRLPLWRLADVAVAWTAAVAQSGAYEARSAHVDMMPGYHTGAVYRPVPALLLRAGETATAALDLDDIRDLTAAEVVALAASRLGLTTQATAADDGPDSEPAPQPALPLPGSQAERHLTRSERRALRRQAHA
jgi:hypothetical protein